MPSPKFNYTPYVDPRYNGEVFTKAAGDKLPGDGFWYCVNVGTTYRRTKGVLEFQLHGANWTSARETSSMPGSAATDWKYVGPLKSQCPVPAFRAPEETDKLATMRNGGWVTQRPAPVAQPAVTPSGKLDTRVYAPEAKKPYQHPDFEPGGSKKDFWLVYSPRGTQPPRVRHSTSESAQAEAARLADKFRNRHFYVVKSEIAYINTQPKTPPPITAAEVGANYRASIERAKTVFLDNKFGARATPHLPVGEGIKTIAREVAKILLEGGLQVSV